MLYPIYNPYWAYYYPAAYFVPAPVAVYRPWLGYYW